MGHGGGAAQDMAVTDAAAATTPSAAAAPAATEPSPYVPRGVPGQAGNMPQWITVMRLFAASVTAARGRIAAARDAPVRAAALQLDAVRALVHGLRYRTGVFVLRPPKPSCCCSQHCLRPSRTIVNCAGRDRTAILIRPGILLSSLKPPQTSAQ